MFPSLRVAGALGVASFSLTGTELLVQGLFRFGKESSVNGGLV